MPDLPAPSPGATETGLTEPAPVPSPGTGDSTEQATDLNGASAGSTALEPAAAELVTEEVQAVLDRRRATASDPAFTPQWIRISDVQAVVDRWATPPGQTEGQP